VQIPASGGAVTRNSFAWMRRTVSSECRPLPAQEAVLLWGTTWLLPEGVELAAIGGEL